MIATSLFVTGPNLGLCRRARSHEIARIPLEESTHFICGDRLAEVVALNFIAAIRSQKAQLLQALDALVLEPGKSAN